MSSLPDSVAGFEQHRVPMDMAGYERRVRSQRCFVCAFLAGEPGYEHHTVFDDGEHVAFLNRYPTLPGYVLVVPRRHVEDVVGGLTAEQYVRLQSMVHQVARAVAAVTNPERTYVMSLGAKLGNAHVHFHVAPLPPGVPYARQQLQAVDAANGILDYSDTEMAQFAQRIRAALADDPFAGGDSISAAGQLVVIRGSSGSGKTTVARGLQRRFGRGRCVVIGQDVVRREFLRESDTPDGVNIEMIGEMAGWCLARGLIVVLEGIFAARRYGDMLDRVRSRAGTARFYTFDLSFEETLRRHATRQKSSSFDRDEMRDWYNRHDHLAFVDETGIDAARSADAIYRDLTSGTPTPDRSQADRPDAGPSPAAGRVDTVGAEDSARVLTVHCWGTSHTEHRVGESDSLTNAANLPAPGTTVTVDRWRTGGFVARLSTGLTTRFPDVGMVVHNHGRSGATSRDLLEIVGAAEIGDDIAVLECGTNDVLRRHQGRLAESVDLDEFTSNYRALLARLTGTCQAVVCLASPPVAAHLGAHAAAINRDLWAYNLAARHAASDAGALFVDCWGTFVSIAALLRERPAEANTETLWAKDGLHLSAVGDEVIARALETALVDQHLISRLAPSPRPGRREHDADRVTVRTASAGDVSACVRLLTDVAAEGKWIRAEPPIDEDAAAAELRDIAGTGGLLVGEAPAAGVIATGTATFTTDGVADLTMMVAAGHRGHGIGAELLDQLIAWCRDNNAHKVTVQVWPHNKRAITLYHQAGFQIEGTLRAHHRRRNGELWDSIIMSRRLPVWP